MSTEAHMTYKLKAITELTIYRDIWARGPDENTALLNENGMCCLGFACQATGVPLDSLFGVGEPEDVEIASDTGEIPGLVEHVEHPDEWNTRQTPLVFDAMAINDDGGRTESRREAALQNLFFGYGIDLRFEHSAPADVRYQYETAVKAGDAG